MRRLGPIAGAAHIAARREPADLALIDDLGQLTLRRAGSARQRARPRLAGRGGRAGRRDRRAVPRPSRRGRRDGCLRQARRAAGVAEHRVQPGPAGRCRSQGRGFGLVHDEEFDDLLSAVPATIRRFTAWGPSCELEAMIAANDGSPLTLPERQGGMVLLTGGTTGTPKGAPRQVRSPLTGGAVPRPGAAASRRHRASSRHRCSTGPALTQFIMTFALGSTVVLRRRFDARRDAAKASPGIGPTALVVVPTMLQRMLAVGPERYDTSVAAGHHERGRVAADGSRQSGDRPPSARCCTTSTARPNAPSPRSRRRRTGSPRPVPPGLPPVGCHVRLYDDADRSISAPDTTGRIFAGNGLSFGGYTGGGHKDMIDGLLSTGDLGHFDAAGRLFVDGRRRRHDRVRRRERLPDRGREPGRGDARRRRGRVGRRTGRGVRPAAAPVRRTWPPGADLDATRSARHVRENLARFKVPREVVFLDELPRTATGKVDRPPPRHARTPHEAQKESTRRHRTSHWVCSRPRHRPRQPPRPRFPSRTRMRSTSRRPATSRRRRARC